MTIHPLSQGEGFSCHKGDKVRLGFEAPRHIPIHRKEVYDAIKKENLQAASLSSES